MWIVESWIPAANATYFPGAATTAQAVERHDKAKIDRETIVTEHPRVLVVEDHALVAMMTRDMVEACGCAAVGPFGSVAGALRALHETPLDGAVLDIHLQGERVWPVAEALQERKVPFLFLSAYTTREVPEQFRKHPLLSKPISLFGLCTVLKGIGTIRPDPPATP